MHAGALLRDRWAATLACVVAFGACAPRFVRSAAVRPSAIFVPPRARVTVVSRDSGPPPAQAAPPVAVAIRAETLTERWRLSNTQPVDVSGDRLLVRVSTSPEQFRYHIVDSDSGSPVFDLAWITPLVANNTWFHRGALRTRGASLAVFEHQRYGSNATSRWSVRDLATGAIQWATAFGSGSSLLFATDEAQPRAWLASQQPSGDASLSLIDVETGRARWTAALASSPVILQVNSSRIVVGERAANQPTVTLRAIDARAGVDLWRLVHSDALSRAVNVDGDDRTLALVHDGKLTVIDAQRGAVLFRADAPPAPVDFTEVAAVEGNVIVQWNRASTIAYDRDGGAVRWRIDGQFHCVRRVGGMLVAASVDRVWHALDPRDGRSLWRYGGGSSCDDESVAFRGGADPLLFLRVLNETIAFAPAANAPVAPTLVVTGRLTVNRRSARGVRVRLGESRTRTDRRGRYRLETTIAGPIELSFDDVAIARAVRDHPCTTPGVADDLIVNDGTRSTVVHDADVRAYRDINRRQCERD